MICPSSRVPEHGSLTAEKGCIHRGNLFSEQIKRAACVLQSKPVAQHKDLTPVESKTDIRCDPNDRYVHHALNFFYFNCASL
jgi:hypothetical protein